MTSKIQLPNIYTLEKVLDRALVVLYRSRDEGREYLSAKAIAEYLTNIDKITTYAPAVRMALIRSPKSFVHKKRIDGEEKFAIMHEGETYLQGLGEPQVLVIDPEKAYTSRRKVESLFQKLISPIKICDPYADPKTLDHLTAIPRGSEIRLLTCKVYDEARFRREIYAYEKEYSKLEVRISRDLLHDRYIISKDNFWLLGHSLNGLGKKEAFIVEIGMDIRMQMETLFDKRWNTAPLI